LVSGDVAIRDFARRIYLSERREAGERSVEKARASGEDSDISGEQSAKYHEPQFGEACGCE
jgi:hypothetical protein